MSDERRFVSEPWIRTRRLKLLRVARGMTQPELARAAGVSQTTVSACERGMSSPSLLEAMAEVLGVEDPQSLLDVVDDAVLR